MIDLAVSISKQIFDIIISRKQTEDEKIIKLSHNLNEISTVLQDTADKFKSNEYPSSNCVVLERLSFDLYKLLSSYIEDEEILVLKSVLDEALLVEKLFSVRNNDVINSLEKAAGEFKYISMKLNF